MVDFCIYVGTHSGDYLNAKVLCASIRYYYPDVPIVILRDGDFSIDQLTPLGNIHLFDDATVPPEVRSWSGYYTKLKIFYSGTCERFLYLDADIVLVGPILSLPYDRSDYFVSIAHDDLSDETTRTRVKRIVFDVDRITEYDPDFTVPQVLTTFNAGHFFARPNLIPVEWMQQAVDYRLSHLPQDTIFPYNDQSILNYLFNRAEQAGITTLDGERFCITPSWEAPEKYPGLTRQTMLDKTYTERYLIHYAGRKPPLLRQYPFAYAMREFYQRYYQQIPFSEHLKDFTDAAPEVTEKLLRYYARKVRASLRGG